MSRIGKISIDQFLDTVEITLEDYAHGVDDCLAVASEEAGKSAENELHRTSPERTGNYRKSWTYTEREVKKGTYRTEMVVYNEKYYRLTHLLEKSHRIANKYGRYGMSKAQPHIEPAQRNAEEKFKKVFEEELGRIRV